MINHVFQLVAPKQISVKFQSISLSERHVVVRPTYLSICAADQRYFNGFRSKEYLKKKLPMALIHEACGQVVSDPTGRYQKADKVLLVPLEPSVEDDTITANYLSSSRFRASGYDGFMQEYVAMDPNCLVPYTSIEDDVAAMSEIMSVAVHSIKTFMRASHSRRESCVVFGDGNLGYIVTLFLKALIPGIKVYVVGVDSQKLEFFSFADDVFLADSIPADLRVDHAFECVGGRGSEDAIDSMIDMVRPEATMMLMGVSEENVPIRTRMVLEKGLMLMGRSRSTKDDFITVRDLLEADISMQSKMKKIIREVHEVRSVADMNDAFNEDLGAPFKTVMKWMV